MYSEGQKIEENKRCFRKINILQCRHAAPAINVAFLTLMTLKVENEEMCVQS